MPSKKGQIAPYQNSNNRGTLSPSDMAGQPKYKIGWRGRPFYLNHLGEWILSSRPIAEVQRIIDFQNNPRREQQVWAHIDK